jgi:ribosomal protein S18 acetylase RimI-like enzyme
VTSGPPDLPEREATLKDGRRVRLRHGRAGDEVGIARLVTAAFPVYRRAARGDAERAIAGFARELRPEQFVVAALAEDGLVIGASCLSGRGGDAGGRVRRLRRKLSSWGAWGMLCFGVEKLRARLLESAHRTPPDELYRYLDAVDAGHRSLGVGRHVADFVEDYARAAGYRAVSAKHRADNQPVLALHRKRGCTLLEPPPTPLGRLFRLPPMVISTRALGSPPTPHAAPAGRS